MRGRMAFNDPTTAADVASFVNDERGKLISGM